MGHRVFGGWRGCRWVRWVGLRLGLLIPVVSAMDSSDHEATDSSGMKPPRGKRSLERSGRLV